MSWLPPFYASQRMKEQKLTYGHLSLSPCPLNDAKVIHQHGGEERFGGVGKAGGLPDESAPKLRIWPEVWGDID
jgi:hypothetical protein